jgi:hypothetical protein
MKIGDSELDGKGEAVIEIPYDLAIQHDAHHVFLFFVF